MVSRLAMEGISNPQQQVLALLCQGSLLARGDFRWRKFQDGDHFEIEEIDSIIKPMQWKALADALADEWALLETDDLPEAYVDLARLGMGRCAAYEWGYAASRFCTARCTPDPLGFPDAGSEEWFSAWDIVVWPGSEAEPSKVEMPEQGAPSASKGGRPPIGDWEGAALEMAGRFYRGDLKPKTIADVARALADWFADQDLHPSDSVVRVHAKRIFAAFQTWDAG